MTTHQTQPRLAGSAFRLAAGMITKEDANRLDALIYEMSPHAGVSSFNMWVLFAWESGGYVITRDTWELGYGLHGSTFDDILAAVRDYYEGFQ